VDDEGLSVEDEGGIVESTREGVNEAKERETEREGIRNHQGISGVSEGKGEVNEVEERGGHRE